MGTEDISKALQKSYFDVLGLCCSAEVVLVERILKPLEGIHKVSVIVASKTVIVVHDTSLITQLQIVKALNQARLEATIRAYGTDRIIQKWPSPYIIACGLLLIGSLFKYFFHPLQWLALAAVVVGLPLIIMRSIAALRRYSLDINFLMLIAVAGAVALRDYSEAGFIVFLFTIAEWLESMASHKAMAGMSALMNMAPQRAVLAETGEAVDVRDVKVDTLLSVKAGEVVPIDGVVVEGRSEVDESSLTGESYPVAKQARSLVWAGTLNLDGYICVKTTALAENSAVAKMARLVEDAQNSRSSTQRIIDSCTKYYTPAVVVIAAGIAVIPLILRVHNPKHWFKVALVALVSACPCALVLSTPVATFCALLRAARTGLLVKGGDVLEALARTRVLALDKTGTITMGEFSIVEFKTIGHGVIMHELLYWVSSIESKSSHPMASALVDYARLKSIDPKAENVSEFSIYPGEGIYGEIDGKNIYIGNKRIATRAGCEKVPSTEDMEGVTVGYVFSGAAPIGIFTLSDTCRTGAEEAIRELKSLGIKTVMLTGDSTAAAMNAQNQLGNAIDTVHAELLPEDKVQLVSNLKTNEGYTTMVGDGLNDAPALAASSVGISMGISGSAIAMETSHITLMSNDIRKIPKSIRLARKTNRKIVVNIVFSLVTKSAILTLALAGHPLLWAAVLADVGTCVVVILNSMLLLQTRTPKEKEKRCHRSHSSHESNGACGSGGGSCCRSDGGNLLQTAGEGICMKKDCCGDSSKMSHSILIADGQKGASNDGPECQSRCCSGGGNRLQTAEEGYTDLSKRPHCDPRDSSKMSHPISIADRADDEKGGSKDGSVYQSGCCGGGNRLQTVEEGISDLSKMSHCGPLDSSKMSHYISIADEANDQKGRPNDGSVCKSGCCGGGNRLQTAEEGIADSSKRSHFDPQSVEKAVSESFKHPILIADGAGCQKGGLNDRPGCQSGCCGGGGNRFQTAEEGFTDSSKRSHFDPQSVEKAASEMLEYPILITDGANDQKGGLNGGSGCQSGCCRKVDIAMSENKPQSGVIVDPRACVDERENIGCCKGCKNEDDAAKIQAEDCNHNAACGNEAPGNIKTPISSCKAEKKETSNGCCGDEKREFDTNARHGIEGAKKNGCCGGCDVELVEIVAA